MELGEILGKGEEAGNALNRRNQPEEQVELEIAVAAELESEDDEVEKSRLQKCVGVPGGHPK
jgi:hypothetical protein